MIDGDPILHHVEHFVQILNDVTRKGVIEIVLAADVFDQLSRELDQKTYAALLLRNHDKATEYMQRSERTPYERRLIGIDQTRLSSRPRVR